MIKKFVSNALLSVVMDKDARKKLQGMRNGDDGGRSNRRPVSKDTSPSAAADKSHPTSVSGEDVVDTIAQALAEARAEVANEKVSPNRAPTPSRPPKAPSSTRTSPEPPRKPAPSKKTPVATPERERLIQEAMAIHRQKSHVLEELDPATREKLMVMAMYAMDPSSLPPEVRKHAKADSKAEGLVDDLGEKAGSLRKKPGFPRK